MPRHQTTTTPDDHKGDTAPTTPLNHGWEWEKRWETGITAIDHQHEQVLDYINDIRSAISARDRLECHALLEELLKFIQEHFYLEEHLMELGQYPYLKEHRKIHSDFLKRLKAHHEAITNGSEISREALRDIKLFLTTHMVEEDKKFAPYVKQNLGDDWFEHIWNRIFR